MPKDSSASVSSSISEIVPHSRPTLGEREREALLAVLDAGHPGAGPQVAALEELATAHFGTPGAVATGSGSQALLLTLIALGLTEGKRVAIPAFTCSAVLHAVQWAGAEPVLLDCAPGSLAPAPEALEPGSVDAVILVHPWGYPLEAGSWCKRAPIVIEDCAGSVGARHKDRAVGSTGEAAVLSFYATKMLCAGEGGLMAAHSTEVLAVARDRRDYDGKSTPARRFNFKMSDLQAALARVQFERLEEFTSARSTVAQRYDETVPALGLTPIAIDPGCRPSYFRYLCWAGGEVDELLAFCEKAGVHCRRPVPVTLDRLTGAAPLPEAERAWRRLVSLPIYPTLTAAEQARVLDTLADARTQGIMP